MKYLTILIILTCLSCSKETRQIAKINPLRSDSQASFRALSVVNEDVAWVSGTHGTVLVTEDGGQHWQDVSEGVPDSIDFRDIEAFSADEAIILAAGSPGIVMKTDDGGQTWRIVYYDERDEIFFDAMGFWNDKSGIAFGDAIDGKIEIITTNDGGNSWQQRPEDNRPKALEGEGGFAASGTCLYTFGDSSVWLALGIPESRVVVSHDRGNSWQYYQTPMAQSTSSGGIFSIGFNDADHGLAIGGDYRNREATEKLLAKTDDGGKSWQLVENSLLNGQKSAITPVAGTYTWLATGATGVSISRNNGATWSPVDSTGYYTIQMANQKTGFLSGPKGRLGKIILSE